jgi:hypothetical protein
MDYSPCQSELKFTIVENKFEIMQKLLLFLSVFIISLSAFAQEISETKHVYRELKECIEIDFIEENGQGQYQVLFKEISTKHVFYPLFSTNSQFFLYLFNRYPVGSAYSNLPISYLDEVRNNPLNSLNNVFFDSLVTDKNLGFILIQTASTFLHDLGYRIKDFKPMKKVKTSDKELQSVASSFFYLELNELRKTNYQIFSVFPKTAPTVEKSILEAFCYQAIIQNFEKDINGLKSDVISFHTKFKDFVVDNDDELANLNTQFYNAMLKSAGLKKSLFQSISKSNIKGLHTF